MRSFFNSVFLLLLVLMLITASPMASAEDTAPSEGYHDYAALTKALQQLADSHKNVVSLISIGKTLKGKDLWMLQILSLIHI